MSSVGPYLRELRERRGVSIEEIARVTRVARRYLEAIEAGRFEELPAPVFTRGFIRSYCQALGEPPDEALARYANPPGESDVAGATPRAAPASALPIERRGRGPVLVSFVLLVVLGVALFAVTLALQAGRDVKIDRRVESPRLDGARADAPASERVLSTAPSAPSPEARLPAPGGPPPSDTAAIPAPPAPAPGGPATTPSPATVPRSTAPDRPATERPLAQPPAPTPGTPSPVDRPAMRSVAAPYRLVARTTQPTWIRVRTEDGHTSEETIPAGQTREWISNRRFTVAIGNAGGVNLELNGVAVPPLGASGVVIPRLVLPIDEP